MDKETLSNYGWIVICILVMVVMIALATPFGSFISGAVQSTTKGLFDVNKSALNNTGLITIDDQEFDVPNGNGDAGENGGTPTKDPALNPNDGTAPQTGDVYTHGDYEYRYNQFYDDNEGEWVENTAQNGWSPRVTDMSKTTYGNILESINGEPITSLNYTFSRCSNLSTAPVIPDSVTSMVQTFQNCRALTIAPAIPNGVTNMDSTFVRSALTSAPLIPSSVKNMNNTFHSCQSLKTYAGSTDSDGDFSNYLLPSGVSIVTGTFQNCRALTIAPAIPNTITSLSGTFANGTSLTTAPAIPNAVTDMYMTFYNCNALTTAPIIPSNVTNMTWTFQRCTSLNGTVEINATNLTSYSACFNGTTQSITLTGNCPKLVEIATTGNNGNITVQ
jgi:hypothetical protein